MKPRLLVIVGRFVIGGHATDNTPLLFHLKEKYEIQIIYGEKEADEIEPLFLLDQFPGLNMLKLPSLKRSINPFADLITLFKVYNCIKTFRPNIVHTHGAKSGFTGRLAAWFYGKTVIVHTFHGHLFHSYFNWVISRLIILVERLMGRITDATITLSASQKKELVEVFKIVPDKKVHEIPLGLFEPASKSFYKNSLRQEYSLSEDDVIIAIVGRIVPIKNHLDFLKIVSLVLQKGLDNVKFFVIGDGNGREEMLKFLNNANISYSLPGDKLSNASIIFTSWIANMYEAIYDVDVVVLTSFNEGTPVSLIEAQLCAKPVVAYNVGGVKDTFINNQSGFLINKGDISTFATRLLKLIESKETRILMGEAGKAYASKKFSKLTEVSLIDDLYKKLLQKPK